jgi:hypothetical protein
MGVMGGCAYLLVLSLMSRVAISREAVRPGPEDYYLYIRPEIPLIGPCDESCSGKGAIQFLEECAIAGKIPHAPLCQRGSATHGGIVTADHVYESCVV